VQRCGFLSYWRRSKSSSGWREDSSRTYIHTSASNIRPKPSTLCLRLLHERPRGTWVIRQNPRLPSTVYRAQTPKDRSLRAICRLSGLFVHQSLSTARGFFPSFPIFKCGQLTIHQPLAREQAPRYIIQLCAHLSRFCALRHCWRISTPTLIASVRGRYGTTVPNLAFWNVGSLNFNRGEP